MDYDRDYDLRSGVLYWIRNKRWGSARLAPNHSFDGWDKAFGKDHPDWFSTKSWAKMQEIIKDPGGYQKKINPVLSNEGLFRKKVEIIRGYFDGKPAPFPLAYRTAGGKTFGIVLNDNGHWNQAPACVKQYEPEMGVRPTMAIIAFSPRPGGNPRNCGSCWPGPCQGVLSNRRGAGRSGRYAVSSFGSEGQRSRLDVSFGFKEHFIRGQKKMRLRTGLALIVMLALAVEHVTRKGKTPGPVTKSGPASNLKLPESWTFCSSETTTALNPRPNQIMRDKSAGF